MNSSGQMREMTQILSRRYEASSTDGSVTAVATGDGRLAAVEVTDVSSPALSEDSTQAVKDAIAAAHQQTAHALAEMPGLNPQLRRLLLAGSDDVR